MPPSLGASLRQPPAPRHVELPERARSFSAGFVVGSSTSTERLISEVVIARMLMRFSTSRLDGLKCSWVVGKTGRSLNWNAHLRLSRLDIATRKGRTVQFVSKNSNPVPDLIEVKTNLTAEEADGGKCKVLIELRVHPCEIEDQLGTIFVEITEAILSLELHGMRVVPNSKLGQPVVTYMVKRDVQIEETRSVSKDNEMAGSLIASGALKLTAVGQKVELNTSGQREAKEKSSSGVTVKTTTANDFVFYRVKAIGNAIGVFLKKMAAYLTVYISIIPRFVKSSPQFGVIESESNSNYW
jgi:hypothetical protein